MGKAVIVLDGAKFSSLKEFAIFFSNQALKGYPWDGNLDAFNDILNGGFGTPEGGFILRWENSALSRERLGETLFDTIVEIIEGRYGIELELL